MVQCAQGVLLTALRVCVRVVSSLLQFMLLPAHADHNVPIFDDAEDGDWVDETPPSPPSSCDAVPRFFIGRNADVQRVVGFFAEKYRCVTVRGELGIGKVSGCVPNSGLCP